MHSSYEVLIITNCVHDDAVKLHRQNKFFSFFFYSPACIMTLWVYKCDYLSRGGSLKRHLKTEKFQEKLLSKTHLPIILLSLARDFYETTQIFSGVYLQSEKKREKKFSICINFFAFASSHEFLLSHRCFACTKGGFSFSWLCFKCFAGNKNVNEIWFYEIKEQFVL